MCGIAGVSSTKPIGEEIAQKLLTTLSHRGPDDQGAYFNPDRTLLLTHNRLSILDISSSGHQPMVNQNQNLWITYNGEVYNFKELREELIAKGYSFRSGTDTEVILNLYQEDGEDCVDRLVGMFAFAIYDQTRQCLFLARDRLGIKPLYYAYQNGAFLFASEIKALLKTGLVSPEVNWQGIWDYFTFSFVPHPKTAFEGIWQLPPAHTLTISLKSGQKTLNRYWNLQAPDHFQGHSSYQDRRDQVRELLSEAVRGELVSDVPVGLFFSGGIDSTILASLMAKHSSEPVKTFTVVFPGQKKFMHDDLAYARLASKAIGTIHHELPVSLKGPEDFLGMVRHVDQPFANPTLYIQYLIAEATRKDVTVALSGAGGDELFGGYPKYWPLRWAGLLEKIPQGVGTGLIRFLDLVREDTWVPYLRKAKRLLRGIGLERSEQYLRWGYSLAEQEKRDLFSATAHSKEPQSSKQVIQKIFKTIPGKVGYYGQVLQAELELYLCDNILEYTDKATMAVALETRVPFLNHRLVELCAKIPFPEKANSMKTKIILIDAFKDELPKEIAQAPKRGFSPPITQWMEQVLSQYFEDVLTPRQIQKDGIFSCEAIQKLRNLHQSGRRDVSIELTGILMFDVWFRKYIHNSS